MLCLGFPVYGAEQADSIAPALSSKGIKRIQENLKIVNENLVDTQKNLSASQNNLKVVQDELSDLDKLEKENHDLLSKYREYVEKADAEMGKNDVASKRVDAELKKLPPAVARSGGQTGGESPTARETLEHEKMDRDAWKTDATSKIKRIRELEEKVQLNLKDIQSRREPLRVQLTTWSSRTKDYENLVKSLTQKKTELEKLAQK
jgi:chromosome segregation ATPase